MMNINNTKTNDKDVRVAGASMSDNLRSKSKKHFSSKKNKSSGLFGNIMDMAGLIVLAIVSTVVLVLCISNSGHGNSNHNCGSAKQQSDLAKE